VVSPKFGGDTRESERYQSYNSLISLIIDRLCETLCTFVRFDPEFASNKLEDQELLMLSLHLLQVSLVYVNTLMMQQVLAQPEWQGRLTIVALRALSPLKWQHVNPYGTFTLNMQARLSLEQVPWSPGATLPKFRASLG
jgi:hypothetical protein